MSIVTMNWTGLIDALGGGRQVARDISTPSLTMNPDTVYAWSRKNRVPAWRRDALIALSIQKGIRLSDYQHDEQAAADAAAKAIRAPRARSMFGVAA